MEVYRYHTSGTVFIGLETNLHASDGRLLGNHTDPTYLHDLFLLLLPAASLFCKLN